MDREGPDTGQDHSHWVKSAPHHPQTGCCILRSIRCEGHGKSIVLFFAVPSSGKIAAAKADQPVQWGDREFPKQPESRATTP